MRLLRRVTVTWLLVLSAIALLVPAVALADGPSAGDQQYIDPLASKPKPKPKPKPTSPTPTPTSQGSSSPPPTTTATPTPTPTPAPTTTTTPTSTAAATTASTTTASTTSTKKKDPSSSKTLPLTGFDAWFGAGIGIALLAAGVTLRRRLSLL